MAAGDYTFGSFLLNDNVNYYVTNAQPSAASPDILRAAFGVREGSALIYRRFTEHIIRIVGLIYGVTKQDAENKKDALILALLSGTQNMKWGYADERYYKATLTGETLLFSESQLVYQYEAQFVLLDPFAYAATGMTAGGLLVFS